jgi:hypothetical protein
VGNNLSDVPSAGDAIVKAEVLAWKTNVNTLLPSGKAGIVMLTNPVRAQITVSFDDSRASGGSSSQSFSSEIEL